jgi:putative hydrolase of the HAD superfamily
VFNSAITGIEKPNASAFESVLSKLPPPPERNVWMIGDNFHADVRGAESLGIPAILVRERHPEARYAFEDLSGLLDLLTLRG